MKIAVSGSSGLIGSAVVERFRAEGHEVLRLVRRSPDEAGSDEISWNAEDGKINPARLEGLDAVVHLAGENIMGRWTAAKKRRILESRVVGTRALSAAIADLRGPRPALISASAIGYYGSRDDTVLTEESESGDGFLPEVCRAWESATAKAKESGVRVVHTRFGAVLSPKGGALKTMLTPFKLGLGGRVGSGRQYMSWVTLDDAARAIAFAAAHASLEGPLNITAPHPVTNIEFTKSLGRALRRPTILPVPGFALRLMFGQVADEALLASTRAFPNRLQEAGFQHNHENIDDALAELLR